MKWNKLNLEMTKQSFLKISFFLPLWLFHSHLSVNLPSLLNLWYFSMWNCNCINYEYFGFGIMACNSFGKIFKNHIKLGISEIMISRLYLMFSMYLDRIKRECLNKIYNTLKWFSFYLYIFWGLWTEFLSVVWILLSINLKSQIWLWYIYFFFTVCFMISSKCD